MLLYEIIQDIHALETKLVPLELRYSLRSADFYHLYKAGTLEQSRDFIRWLGYYAAKLEREARYQDLMDEYLHQQTGLGVLQLTPQIEGRFA